MPRSQRTASFLWRLSPLELILIAGSFPRFPHLLMVKGETRKSSETSRTVSKSGRSSSLMRFLVVESILIYFSACRLSFLVARYQRVAMVSRANSKKKLKNYENFSISRKSGAGKLLIKGAILEGKNRDISFLKFISFSSTFCLTADKSLILSFGKRLDLKRK